MAGVEKRKIRRVISLLLAMLYCSNSPAQAKYAGGSGTAEDPYRIYTAEQMNEIGLHKEDWDKHFKLMADIDLAGFSYDRGVIAPDMNTDKEGFQGRRFTGVFDGNGHTISHLTIKGVNYLGLFGRLESGAEVRNLGLVDVNITGSSYSVGGLVGDNRYGSITTSYSTGAVSGNSWLGGLIGYNWGDVTASYSTSAVSGNKYVGGLVGENIGFVSQCYSTGAVSGNELIGGLVGRGNPDRVSNSLWDMQTSNQGTSAGGIGLTTAELMHPVMLGLNGFGGDPDWVLGSAGNYPRLAWEEIPGQMIPEPAIDWLDGAGTPEDRFQIKTADQLLLIHKSSLLWDKHFVLNADIDLDPSLPGRSVLERAVIHTFEGSFIGSGHVILNLQIEGGDSLGLFGKLTKGSVVRDLGLENVSVHGTGFNVGGLVGYNLDGHVFNCYSTGAVNGDLSVGGLVGYNQSFVTECYSTAVVTGDWSAGGLVGSGNLDRVTYCFWDTQTSGQDTSAGGTGLTTVEMQTASTFLDAGWDFVGEVENGTEDIWWILEGQGYPKLRELPEGILLRPLPAFCLAPKDGATDVTPLPILYWAPADPNVRHDIYLGESKQAVVNATTLTLGIYRGRQPGEVTAYDAGILEWGKTYYWRIDEVNQNDPNSPHKGNVWSFATGDFILVDDFESYNDLDSPDSASNRTFDTWIDGFGSTTNGALVGDDVPPWPTTIVHSGEQSMTYHYNNSGPANYSEATADIANLSIDEDWTMEGVGVLSLWFYGNPVNAPESMYVALADATGPAAVVYYDDNPYAVLIDAWTQWTIDLQECADQGVHLAGINTISIGFGEKNNPQSGGRGLMFFDDIRLYPPTPEPAP